MNPRPGDVVLLGAAASVQFAGGRAVHLAVIRLGRYASTPAGWVWLTGYQLDPLTGQALAVRNLFVRAAGMQLVPRARRHPGGAVAA